MTEPKTVRLDHLLGVYSVGSGDWPWAEEYDNLIDQPDTRKLLDRIRAEGIREPILLGTDGRIWDGHHRIVIAMHLGLDSVPVEFAGASVVPAEPEWEYGWRDERQVEWDGKTNLPASTARIVYPYMVRPGMVRVRRRKAGPWEPASPLEGQGNDD